MSDLLHEKPHRSWSESARLFVSPKVLALLFLGFSAGVPILLVFSTLSVWLREAGVERAAIGFFSWAALGYGFKFVWAPLIDKLPVPVLSHILGQRRSWLLVAQGLILIALAFMALTDPVQNLTAMAVAAVMLGFSSATQDIVVDAYRIEAAEEDLQGLMSAAYIAGYRLGMLVAGAGALELAGILDVVEGYDYSAWRTTYLAMVGVMGVGIATTFVISEPERPTTPSDELNSTSDYIRFVALFAFSAAAFVGGFIFWGANDLPSEGFFWQAWRLIAAVAFAIAVGRALVKAGLISQNLAHETYVAPFADFFKRYGKIALLILALIATFRISDVVMGVMANVFYVDLGFEKQEIGRITKGFGLIATIVGGFMGGLLTARYGVMKTLFLGGILVAVTNALFALLAGMGPDIRMLAAVIAADNLSGGIASAAFVAYLSGLTSKGFTATQYALFSSMMLLLPKLIAGYSGLMVEALGYATFFIGAACIGVIPLILILFVARLTPKP
ncbi:MAG: MFS transporter [Magnetovibrio sp.]|nr:MFS transporter [Magnetovibrio sp.]